MKNEKTIEQLKEELKKLEYYKNIAEKNKKSKETVYFTEPLKVDDEVFESLTFRRPLGKDVRSIGDTQGIAATYQMARVLCPELNDVSDDEFDEMDWQKHLKGIIGVIEGFM